MTKTSNMIFVFVTLLGFTLSWSGEYAVIVNKNNPNTSIKKSSLKRIFLGKMKKWKNQKIIPINLSESHALSEQFIKDITKKEYSNYKKYWIAQQITGAGSPPVEQKTINAVKQMVSENAGAIAYIPKNQIDDSVKEIEIK